MYTQVNFSKNALKEYRKLQTFVNEGKKGTHPTYKQLLKSINKTIELIGENPYKGEYIPKRYITKNIIEQYGTHKIFRIELVGYWRLLYTLIGEETHIMALVIDYMNHDEYNKLFGYKKK